MLTPSSETIDGVQIVGLRDITTGLDAAQMIDLTQLRDFFTQQFLPLTEEASCIILDLSNITTLDSSSLTPIVQRYRTLSETGGMLVLCGVFSQNLREILSLTRFDRIFAVCETREDALIHIREKQNV